VNLFKQIIIKSTGYWLYKINDLPVGADLFVDIQHKIKYSSLNLMFDVGANIGQTWNWFRHHQPKTKIYSFEPVQSTFEQLQKRVAGDSNCVIEKKALGDEPGEKRIRLFESDMAVLNSLREDVMNNSAHAQEELITVDTLDNYCNTNQITKIDLLKIDTEGFELNVLKGAKEMMKQGKISFIYCETGFQKQNTRNTYFAELTEFLAAQHYYFYGLYQVEHHDWIRGNGLGNALYIHVSVFPQ
jgi:FkbM family methyltransferase